MSNEDQHLRDRDEVAQDLLIARIKQAQLNAVEWRRRAVVAYTDGDNTLGNNLMAQADEEIKRHGH